MKIGLGQPIRFLCIWADSLTRVEGLRSNLLTPISLVYQVGQVFFKVTFPQWFAAIAAENGYISNQVLSAFDVVGSLKTDVFNYPVDSHKDEGLTERIVPGRKFYIHNTFGSHWVCSSYKLKGAENILNRIVQFSRFLFCSSETVFYFMAKNAISKDYEKPIGYFATVTGSVCSGLSFINELFFLKRALFSTEDFKFQVKEGLIFKKHRVKKKDYKISKGELFLSSCRIVRSLSGMALSGLYIPGVKDMPRAKLAAKTVLWLSNCAEVLFDTFAMGKRPEIGTAPTK